MRMRPEASGVPFLDIGSHARKGPGRRAQLSREDIEPIARTVRRTPEVMVKVLSQGAADTEAVARHLEYLSPQGRELEIGTELETGWREQLPRRI